MQELGKKIPDQETADIFEAPEGASNLYYGKIGSGKTYGATADIIEELKLGRVVYATWPILVENFDDRESFFMILKNIFLFRKVFYKIPCADNFHYIDAEHGTVDGIETFNPQYPETYIAFLNTLNHCSLYIDEAWRVIDSYMPVRSVTVDARNLILVTRHKFRTVNLIAQRPTSISAYARGNINRFYKFVKIGTWPWVRFARYEFQEMVGDNVDEMQEPISTKKYWASQKIYDAYNSYYYGDLRPLHEVSFEAYILGFFTRFKALGKWIVNLFSKSKKVQKSAEFIENSDDLPF